MMICEWIVAVVASVDFDESNLANLGCVGMPRFY